MEGAEMHGSPGQLALPVLAILTLALAAAPASSATLTLTSGTLTIVNGSLPPISVPLNGPLTISVSSGHGSFALPADLFGPASVVLPRSLFTGTPQISGLTLAGAGNSAQTVSCAAGGCSGVGALEGRTIVNVMSLLNISIPLAVVGQPGASVTPGVGAIRMAVIGQGWTTGTAVVGPVDFTTDAGQRFVQTTTATARGSDARTPGHGGQITLVSGFHYLNNVAGPFPSFAFQTLRFAPAPEPAPLALLATGLGALMLRRPVGRRR